MRKSLRRGIALILSVSMLLSVASAAEYVVVSGDNLSKIAAMYDTTWWDLADYNNLSNPSLIYPGDVINIPGVEAEVEVVPEATPVPTVAPTATPTATPTAAPTVAPTAEPTPEPTPEPEPEVEEVVDYGPAPTNVIYVDVDATGANDGTSWTNAYADLQDALAIAVAGKQIWVAEGTYYPTDDDDISIYFKMIDDVAVYGGFAGYETSMLQRDYENNVTILSGDVGVAGDSIDNSKKVVLAANNIIDGFTITGGYGQSQGYNSTATTSASNTGDTSTSLGHVTTTQIAASGAENSIHGNGIMIWQTAPTVQNCIITDNAGGKGGGIYIYSLPTSGEIPTFINCTISDNTATGRGGGIALDVSSTAVIIDCIFDGNACTMGKGGGLYADFGCSPYLDNCLFINNVAEGGAAMANDGSSSPFYTNCTMINNHAYEEGGALYQGTGTFNDPVVIDCIIWDNTCDQGVVSIYNWHECNPIVSYSIVEGGYDGVGNSSADPMIIDYTTGEYSSDSPAATAGSDGGAIGYDASIVGTRTIEDCDSVIEYLLALEKPALPTPIDFTNSNSTTTTSTVIYVDASATGSDNGASWTNAYTSLQTAIDVANASYEKTGKTVSVWVAAGTYYTGTERSDSFMLREGVSVYGGFAGTESTLAARDCSANVTILSGEIGDTSVKTDNAFHVVIGADATILDGFTITGGYADGVGGETYDVLGGALLNYTGGSRVRPGITPTIGFDLAVANCVFEDNYAYSGGAAYSYHGANVTYDNCSFIDNSAIYGGANMEVAGSTAVYTDCSFIDNTADFKGGAVMIDYGAIAVFYDTTFEGNYAGTAGGALYLVDRASQSIPNEMTYFFMIVPDWGYSTDIFSSVYAEGCTFTDNTAVNNGSVAYIYEDSFGYFKDCTFSGNTSPDVELVATNEATIIINGGTVVGSSFEAATYADDVSSIEYASGAVVVPTVDTAAAEGPGASTDTPTGDISITSVGPAGGIFTLSENFDASSMIVHVYTVDGQLYTSSDEHSNYLSAEGLTTSAGTPEISKAGLSNGMIIEVWVNGVLACSHVVTEVTA